MFALPGWGKVANYRCIYDGSVTVLCWGWGWTCSVLQADTLCVPTKTNGKKDSKNLPTPKKLFLKLLTFVPLMATEVGKLSIEKIH